MTWLTEILCSDLTEKENWTKTDIHLMAQMNHEFIARKVSGNSYLVKQLSGKNFYNERKEDAK